MSLQDYIAVKEKYAKYLPHSAGRFAAKRFRKAQVGGGVCGVCGWVCVCVGGVWLGVSGGVCVCVCDCVCVCGWVCRGVCGCVVCVVGCFRMGVWVWCMCVSCVWGVCVFVCVGDNHQGDVNEDVCDEDVVIDDVGANADDDDDEDYVDDYVDDYVMIMIILMMMVLMLMMFVMVILMMMILMTFLQCPIVERLVNSLMMHGRNNGKKLMTVRWVRKRKMWATFFFGKQML